MAKEYRLLVKQSGSVLFSTKFMRPSAARSVQKLLNDRFRSIDGYRTDVVGKEIVSEFHADGIEGS